MWRNLYMHQHDVYKKGFILQNSNLAKLNRFS